MSERRGNREGTRVSLRQGTGARTGAVWRALARLLLWAEVERGGEPEPHLPAVTSYRTRGFHRANDLTLLPVGTLFIAHHHHAAGHISDDLVWQVFTTGRAVLISHNTFSTEDTDFFEDQEITILAVVPEHVLVARENPLRTR